jgi:thiol-disulfide isomerase/thioredoxin
MKNLKKAIILSIALCLPILTLHAQINPTIKNLGEPAPALSISKWIKGAQVEGFQKGKIYVVEFWATWCQPCIAGMPHLSELARTYTDVTFIGCSVFEKKGTDLTAIEKFVAGMGNKMDYHVAAEEGTLMATNWLHAFGERGIPQAFVVDKDGLIAWVGLPGELGGILPQIIAGKWDIKSAATKRKELQRLTIIDNNEVSNTMRPIMAVKNYNGILNAVEKILAVEPQLKYYPLTGHYTFWSLVKTDPAKALIFGKEWMASGTVRYATINDVISETDNLPPALYIFGADACQDQLNRYPWSMNFVATYKKMADLYFKAGNKLKGEEYLKKAADYKD